MSHHVSLAKQPIMKPRVLGFSSLIHRQSSGLFGFIFGKNKAIAGIPRGYIVSKLFFHPFSVEFYVNF